MTREQDKEALFLAGAMCFMKQRSKYKLTITLFNKAFDKGHWYSGLCLGVISLVFLRNE